MRESPTRAKLLAHLQDLSKSIPRGVLKETSKHPKLSLSSKTQLNN